MNKPVKENYRYKTPWQGGNIGNEITFLLSQMTDIWNRVEEKQGYCQHFDVYTSGHCEDGETYLCQNCGLVGAKGAFPTLPEYVSEGTPRNIKEVSYSLWAVLIKRFNPSFRSVVE